jgi:hypothetical protein
MAQETQSFTRFVTSVDDSKIKSFTRIDLDVTNCRDDIPENYCFGQVREELRVAAETPTPKSGVKIGDIGETIRWTTSALIVTGV